MKEYIERDKLLDAVFELPPKMDAQGYGWIARGSLYQLIRDFQSADVQPVVHCKDCQYWQESRYGIIEMDACLRFDSPLEKDGFIFKANAEDFCSFAKRRAEA